MRHARSIRPRPPLETVSRAGARFGERRASGFTVVELVVVLAIVAVAGSIGIVRYGSALASYRADCAARRIVEDLRLAQTQARTTSAPRTVRFLIGGTRYAVLTDAEVAASAAGSPTLLGGEPYHARLGAVDLGGDAEVRFDAFGEADVGGTIAVTSGAMRRVITVEEGSGRARVTSNH